MLALIRSIAGFVLIIFPFLKFLIFLFFNYNTYIFVVGPPASGPKFTYFSNTILKLRTIYHWLTSTFAQQSWQASELVIEHEHPKIKYHGSWLLFIFQILRILLYICIQLFKIGICTWRRFFIRYFFDCGKSQNQNKN